MRQWQNITFWETYNTDVVPKFWYLRSACSIPTPRHCYLDLITHLTLNTSSYPWHFWPSIICNLPHNCLENAECTRKKQQLMMPETWDNSWFSAEGWRNCSTNWPKLQEPSTRHPKHIQVARSLLSSAHSRRTFVTIDRLHPVFYSIQLCNDKLRSVKEGIFMKASRAESQGNELRLTSLTSECTFLLNFPLDQLPNL